MIEETVEDFIEPYQRIIFEDMAFTNRGIMIKIPPEDGHLHENDPYVQHHGEKEYNTAGLLFLPSQRAMQQFKLSKKKRQQRLKELAILKDAICDFTLPGMLRTVYEDEYDDNSTVHDGEGYGREELISEVANYGFDEALPQIEKVMMADSDYFLKEMAVRVIASFATEEAATALCKRIYEPDLWGHNSIRRDAAFELERLPFKSNIPYLKKVVEESRYLVDSSGNNILTNRYSVVHNIALNSLCALAAIGHIEAGETIAETIDDSIEPVTSWARDSMIPWIKNTRRSLIKIPYSHDIDTTQTFINKSIIRYGLDELAPFYETKH